MNEQNAHEAGSESSARLDRAAVWARFGGRCAYCGQEIPKKGFHVDHVHPIFRGLLGARERDAATDKFPSCRRCNLWKSVHSSEGFRREIESQIDRVRRDSAGFRLAEDFGQVQWTCRRVVFYFEHFGQGPA
jgi:5-methylcytosine-specific restriction endonuclease McrA